MKALLGIIKKDLKLFFNNPKAVVITLLVPIAVGTFMGSLTGGMSGKPRASRVRVLVVSQDEGSLTGEIIESIRNNPGLNAELVEESAARAAVGAGKAGVAVIFPKGFGDAAAKSMFLPRNKPQLTVLSDPSKSMELAMVNGLLTQNIMQIVSRESFGGGSGKNFVKESLDQMMTNGVASKNPELAGMLRGIDHYMSAKKDADASKIGAKQDSLAQGISVPYETRQESVSQKAGFQYNGYAHSFAGMAVQFVLMFSVETGIALLLERQRGLWGRLRSAPLSKSTVLLGRGISSALIALLTLAACWSFCLAFLGVRINGNFAAFFLCNIVFAMFAASSGLLLAAIGRSPEATKGISIFAVLMLVMLGGAWIPTFVFPEWLQKATAFVPTRWAVDGFDGATWRGLGFQAILLPVGVMLGYTILFSIITVWKFKWEDK